MSDFAARHAGTLDGTLTELGARSPVVAVRVEPEAAFLPAVQHTAWMVLNLLVRLEGVVSEVLISGGDAPLKSRVIPLASGAGTLQAMLLEGAAAIGGVPARGDRSDSADFVLQIGPGAAAAGWRVYGEGYCGAISRHGIASVTDSTVPFGPYIAASLAVGEIFRAARTPADVYRPTDHLSYSAWDYTTGPGELHEVGPDLNAVALDFGLAGVGAVGCAALHTIWACTQLTGHAVIADADPEGIAESNLNRCAIFGHQHVGKPKATTAAAVCGKSGVAFEAVDGQYAREDLPRVPGILVSAVDTNRSRDQLQQGFWPARLVAASTKDLRAEIVRCGPPGKGPCLRCFNPPDVDRPDDLHREQLRGLPPEQLEAFAARIGHPITRVRRWAEEGGCGEVGDAALAQMRASDGPAAMFAVGFVSALAGTLLAAELVKVHIGGDAPLDDEYQIAKFQFLHPATAGNGRAGRAQRDPACPACTPGQPGARTWLARAAGWSPPR